MKASIYFGISIFVFPFYYLETYYYYMPCIISTLASPKVGEHREHHNE